jgi:hypothetical protein
MNERVLPSPALNTIFISKEASNCPLISEMLTLCQNLQVLGLTDKEYGTLSLDYGKRILINAKQVDLKKITPQDIVEIVDYDPLKNIMMVIGLKDPAVEAPVHWIIQKARYDINALLQISSISLFEKCKTMFPSTEQEAPPATLERAKDILKTLRNRKTILIKNEGILFAGLTIKEIMDTLNRHFRV